MSHIASVKNRRLRPANGDIVVLPTNDGRQFVVLAAPGPEQIVVNTREEAICSARRYAQRFRVGGAWLNADGAYTLVEDFRAR